MSEFELRFLVQTSVQNVPRSLRERAFCHAAESPFEEGKTNDRMPVSR